MPYLSHRYQVKVIRVHGDRPVVQGIEEINVNGQRRVRYFAPRTPLPTDLGFGQPWGSSQPSPWFADEIPLEGRSPRRIAVEVMPDSSGSRPSTIREGWQRSRRFLQHAVRKVNRVVQNLPSALAATWRELNR